MNTRMGADDEESEHSCNIRNIKSLEPIKASIAIFSDFALWMYAEYDAFHKSALLLTWNKKMYHPGISWSNIVS